MEDECGVPTDCVCDDRKKKEVFKKVIMSLISIAAIVAGEFFTEENNDNFKRM